MRPSSGPGEIEGRDSYYCAYLEYLCCQITKGVVAIYLILKALAFNREIVIRENHLADLNERMLVVGNC